MIEKNVRLTVDLKYTIYGFTPKDGIDPEVREDVLRENRLLQAILEDETALKEVLAQSAVSYVVESGDWQGVHEKLGTEPEEEQTIRRVIEKLDEKDKLYFQECIENGVLSEATPNVSGEFLNPDNVEFKIEVR